MIPEYHPESETSTIADRELWIKYEWEKYKLALTDPSAEQYEKGIRDIMERMGI